MRSGRLRDLAPRKIVAELDRHVVGQAKAKRAVAIALRERWRRQQLPPEIAREITPKNILMIGPTGVGKTEIARRIARLADAPFVKVEASKFTEVGYVGRDVDSIARDLVDAAIRLVKEERRARVADRAAAAAEETLVALLVAQPPPEGAPLEGRDRIRRELKEGKLEAREVEIEVADDRTPQISVMTPQGVEEMGIDLPGMMPGLFGGPKKKKVRTTVAEARPLLVEREADALTDEATVPQEAIRRAEESGDRLSGRDRQDRGTRREGGGPGRLARRGAARPSPARRGDVRQDEARHGQDRPCPFHRGRRLPRRAPVGPDPRAAGALPDPRLARHPDGSGLRPDPDRAGARPSEAGRAAPLRGPDRRRLRARTASPRSPAPPRR